MLLASLIAFVCAALLVAGIETILNAPLPPLMSFGLTLIAGLAVTYPIYDGFLRPQA